MRFYNQILYSLLCVFCFAACNRDESDPTDIQESAFLFTLDTSTSTRATDIAFEEGDEIGLFAVKRTGDAIGTMLASDNFCDNRKYVYHGGNFQPATTSDIIYPPAGEKVDFYAYYPYKSDVNPLALTLSSYADQSIGSNYQSSDYLWAKAEGGYNGKAPVSLTFAHLMGLVEVVITKNGSDEIISAKIAKAMIEQKGNLQTGALNLTDKVNPLTMLLKEVTPSQYTFRALVPGGNLFSSGKEALYFTMQSGMKRIYTSDTNLPVQSGKVTRFTLNVEDVITYGSWSVSVSASPTTIAASGGSSTISASASRDVLTNGIKTSTETAIPAIAASGTGFSLNGTTLSAGNNTGSSRSCIVAASHGGVSNTCTVTQNAVSVTYGSWSVSVSASPTTIAASGGSSTISASASRDVLTNGIKTSTETAIPVIAASGTGFSLNGTTLSAGNNTGSSRSCIVAASHGGVSNTCTVTQNAVSVTYGSWSVSVSASPTTIAASGGSSTISASASRPVYTNGIQTDTETATPSLSASGIGFTLSGTTLSAGNNTGSSRSCTITASHGGVNRTCTVTQSGTNITYGSWSVSVSASPTTIAASGGSSTISASASRPVYTNGIQTDTETATPSLSASGIGFSLNGTTLSAGNNTGSSRSCTVTASHGGVNRTCTVTQSGTNITYGSWSVSVSASPTTIAASGGSSTISASASRPVYTNGIQTDTETATPSLSASGIGFSLSGTTLSAGNNTGSSRSCTVTASHGGVNRTCTVTQQGVQNITWTYNLIVTPTFMAFTSKGGSKKFTVTSTRTKIIDGISTGITEDAAYTTAISGTNASAFSVSGTSVVAKDNPTTDFRDGTLTITQVGAGGKYATVILEQEGKVDIDTEI